jgi:hypothetical protein
MSFNRENSTLMWSSEIDSVKSVCKLSCLATLILMPASRQVGLSGPHPDGDVYVNSDKGLRGLAEFQTLPVNAGITVVAILSISVGFGRSRIPFERKPLGPGEHSDGHTTLHHTYTQVRQPFQRTREWGGLACDSFSSSYLFLSLMSCLNVF